MNALGSNWRTLGSPLFTNNFCISAMVAASSSDADCAWVASGCSGTSSWSRSTAARFAPGIRCVVHANLPELRLLQHPRENVPHVALLERRAFERGEYPLGHRFSFLQPAGALLAAPIEQDREELGGHVDAAPLMRLRRREDPAHQVPLDDDESAVPVDIGPLDCDLLAQTESRPQGQANTAPPW
jgi:hypothetical protein